MAEKIYTTEEINKINGAASAIKDTVYTDTLGNKYVGTSNGNLYILQRASAAAILAGITWDEVAI